MKKSLLLFLFQILLFGSAWSQDQSLSLIEVDGKSEVKVIPDEALILVSLTEKGMKTSEVTNGLNKKSKMVSDALKDSGVADYQFTADNYYVNINRIYTKGTAKDSGYVASQSLKIVVKDTENDLLKVVETLHQVTDMTFQLQFRISEEKRKEYEEELLKMALENAKYKAGIIASTMDIGQYQIHKVVYTSGESFQPVMYRSESMMMKSADDRTAPTFNPEEQTISDKVRVVFSFSPK
ncbi:MAG: SIMPL domain-containing protein [Cyclobacteriaceae bacterium]